MCGQSNPDHLDVCEHCQARLTPLTGPLGAPAGSSADPAEPADAADANPQGSGDWLSGMRPDSEDSAEQDDAGWADEDVWDELDEPGLTGLLDEDPEDSEPVSSETPAEVASESYGELPDWLADDQPDPSPKTKTSRQGPIDLPNIPDIPEAPEFDDDDELPGWLTEERPDVGVLPGETPLDLPGQVEAEDAAAVDPDDIPDWLTPDAAASEGSDLSWMQSNTPESTSEPREDDELDWLPSASGPSVAADDKDVMDWASNDSLETDATVSSAPEDWLSELEEKMENSEHGTESAPAFVGSNLVPPEDSEPADIDIPAEALPDWLKEDDEKPEPSVTVGPELEFALDAEPSGNPQPSDELDDDEDLPEWLTKTEEDDEAEDTGDWLEDFTSQVQADQAESDQPGERLLDEVADEETISLGLESGSAWMSELEAIESDRDDESSDTEDSPSEDNDLNLDLGFAEGNDDDPLAALGISSSALEAVRPEDNDLSLQQQMDAAIASDDFEERDLPEWLKKMRPEGGEVAGQVVEEYSEGSAERLGPLSGLRGLLSAEPDITQAGRPPVYSALLDVTDVQIERTRMLEKIVAEQVSTSFAPNSGLVSQQRVLRWLILGVLLVAVLVPLLLDTSFNPAPIVASLNDIQRETTIVHSLINDMGDEPPVLLVFDYDPGYSGELEAASHAIVDHLMLKGSRLVIVSSSPLGPSVGERFIRQILADHEYQPGTQYVNLGYVAGGVSGLAAFAGSPYGMTVVGSHDRPIWQLFTPDPVASPWAQPAMVGIQTLSDFEMTFVMSDDPDLARGWIEQVQPSLRLNSLVMIVSAQAEPLLRPYYPAQIAGLVDGMNGGRIYEHTIGREASATAYWEPYGIAMFLVAILVLVGSFYNMYLYIEARDKEGKA
jgi:hypothetical protein